MKKILTVLSFAFLMAFQVAPVSAYEEKTSDSTNSNEVVNETTLTAGKARAGWRYTLHRGSFLLWSDDIVNYNISSGKITSSYGDQDWGWIIPNYIEGKGITKVSSSSSQHTYRGKKYITAGIPTPWGAIGPYGTTVSDYLKVYSNGNATWW